MFWFVQKWWSQTKVMAPLCGCALTVITHLRITAMFMNTLKQDMSVLQVTIASFVTRLALPGTPLESTMFGTTVLKNKDFYLLCLDLDEAITNSLLKTVGGWLCTVCQFTSKFKQRAWEHVEAKHMNTGGYTCILCQKYCPTASSLRNHNDRHHKIKMWFCFKLNDNSYLFHRWCEC